MNKIFTVGFISKYGDWQIRTVNLIVSPENNFEPEYPVNLQWPDGIRGTFLKESLSGKCFYKEI